MTISPVSDWRAKAAPAALPLLIFGIFFYFVVLQQTQGMRLIPGDLGDARLNMYFLEHIYKVVTGQAASFWQFGFYHPYPYVLGMSDNLYGASPVYLTARFAGADPYSSFQVWIMVGFAANFAAAYWALRRLGASSLGASVGAVIFTFALPAMWRLGHAQLHYRFAIPVAIAAFVIFLNNRNSRYLAVSMVFALWQFFCSIYLGLFLLLFMLFGYVAHYVYLSYTNIRSSIASVVDDARQIILDKRILFLFCSIFIAIVILFYPYLIVSRLYFGARPLSEVVALLPTPISYLSANSSWIWENMDFIAPKYQNNNYEHQMFFGLTTLILSLSGYLFYDRTSVNQKFVLFIFMAMTTLVLLTLNVGGASLWLYLVNVPVLSAIRAFTRIDLILLFGLGFFAALAIDTLRSKGAWAMRFIGLVILPALLIEASWSVVATGEKQKWRQRVAATELRIPADLKPDAILLFAQQSEPLYAAELDAMWAAINHNRPTLNGYTSMIPPGVRLSFGNDCTEAPRRVLGALTVTGEQDNIVRYREIMRRIVPIGFAACDPRWLEQPPPLTRATVRVEPAAFARLSYAFEGWQSDGGRRVAMIRIQNNGTVTIPALSTARRSIRMSWRAIDAQGKPLETWDINRFDLPTDISAGSAIVVPLPVAALPPSGGELHVSLVQENEFWAHDVGLPALRIPIE